MTAAPGTVSVTDGCARFTGSGRRMRVLLFCSDDPQHEFLRRRLAERVHLVASVVEPGTAQRRRLWRGRRRRAAVFREYHRYRQMVTGRAAYRHAYFDGLADGDADRDVPRHVVDWCNGDRARDLVRELGPDLTVVCGTGVLSPDLVEATPGLIVNVHGGWLPEYKGNHCVYFAYRNADWDRIGATVHILTTRLDSGAEIVKVAPEIYPHDNDEHLYLRAVHMAIEAVTDLAVRLERGEEVAVRPQEERGVTYRHRDRTPLAEVALWTRRSVGRHRPPRREAVVSWVV